MIGRLLNTFAKAPAPSPESSGSQVGSQEPAIRDTFALSPSLRPQPVMPAPSPPVQRESAEGWPVCRPAQLSDAVAVQALKDAICIPLGIDPSIIPSALTNIQKHDVHVAMLGGEVKGYIDCYYSSTHKRINIDAISVDPSARGRKLGEELLLGGLTRASERGIKNVTLQVETGNAAAKNLYQKYGFVPTRPLIGYYPRSDAEEMVIKDLAAPTTQALLQERRQQLDEQLAAFPSQHFSVVSDRKL